MKIERWFKGCMVHGNVVDGYEEPGVERAECLGSIVTGNEWRDIQALDRMAGVIARLFPGRICDCWGASIQVVHFNNAPETTREDVDKVLLAYTEEVEAASG